MVPLLKVAAELVLLARRAACAGSGLCLQEISSGSAVLRVWGCAGVADEGMLRRNRPAAAVPCLGGLLLMSAGAPVSSLGAGNAKGAVLRLTHSLSTGAELRTGVVADAGAEAMRLIGTGCMAVRLLLMGSMGDLALLPGGETTTAGTTPQQQSQKDHGSDRHACPACETDDHVRCLHRSILQLPASADGATRHSQPMKWALLVPNSTQMHTRSQASCIAALVGTPAPAAFSLSAWRGLVTLKWSLRLV